MVKPNNIVAAHVDATNDTVYADEGLPDLQIVGQLISSGTFINGALVHGSLAENDEDDHPHYTLADGTRAFTGNVSNTATPPTLDSHLVRKDYVDAVVTGTLAGVSTVNTVAGEITISGAGEVSVTTAGQVITVSGTDHTAGGGGSGDVSNALVGDDGIVVTSGASTDTISGFYTEFVNASGTLSTHSALTGLTVGDDHTQYSLVDGTKNFTGTVGGLDPVALSDFVTRNFLGLAGTALSGSLVADIGNEITIHAAISDAHHVRYTKDENDALTGSDGITIVSGSNTIDIVGFETEFVSASGSLQDQIDAVVSAGVVDINSVAGSVVVTGTDGVSTITVGQTITISGVASELDHGALGGLEGDDHSQYALADGSRGFSSTVSGVDPVDLDDLATKNYVDTQDVSISGHLQSGIDAVASSNVDSINAAVGDITVTGSRIFPITTIGQTITVSGADFLTNLENSYDGSLSNAEHGHAVSSDGATITYTLTRADNAPATLVQISGSNRSLAVPTSVSLTPAGTDTNPQENFVYAVSSGTEVALEANITGFPAIAHARIGRTLVQTAVGTQTNGPLKLHVYIDHSSELGAQGNIGHINAINERIRAQFAEWQSGTALTYTEDTGPTPDDITIQVATGVVYQLHPQDTPAFDTSASDFLYVFNDGSTPYQAIQSLSELTEYNDGSPISNIDRFNVVIWGAVAETGADSKLFLNVPATGYNNDQAAIDDSNNTAVFSVPRLFVGVGWLIAKLTIKISGAGNTWTILQNQDLRGATPGSFPGGVSIGGGGVTDHGLLTGLTDDDHFHYSLVDGTRAFTGTVGGITPVVSTDLTTKLYVDTDTSALAASGLALQAQITAVEDSDVDDINSIVGSVTIAGSGETVVTQNGQVITISGTPHPSSINALVGDDGITVTSGDPIDTISGFYTEFVSASGSLQTQINSPSLAGLVEDTNGLFFQTATGTLTLIASGSYGRDIIDFSGRTETGTVSGTLLIDDVDVEGISAVTWDTTASTKHATGNNTISAGSRVVLAVSGVSNYTEFEWSYKTTRT
jgi:hypothetical protein